MPVSPKHKSQFPTPYWRSGNASLYLGDVRDRLRDLPERSVHCTVTSPPYWGLRSYNNAADVKHLELGVEDVADCLGWATGSKCGQCFVCHMVEVFTDVHRVLRDDGTLWLNLGDTFDGGQGMVPESVAMALRAAGWKLVQRIIWYSPNKMPESVTNRCTKSHEHIFLLTKSDRYYFDHVAIQEAGKGTKTGGAMNYRATSEGDCRREGRYGQNKATTYTKVNKRDVWIVPTRGYEGAHFACFTPQLITPCILVGTSEAGCCSKCGAPHARVTQRVGGQVTVTDESDGAIRDRSFDWSRNGKPGSNSTLDGVIATTETVGWKSTCLCESETSPCVVLDPFVGSGTTVATAVGLGRAGIGIDLSEVYLRECAIPRISGVGPVTVREVNVMPAISKSNPPAFESL